MIIFIRTQKKATAADNFFNALIKKCNKNYILIEERNKDFFSFFKLIINLNNQIKDKNQKYILINDFGFFKNVFTFLLTNLPSKKIKIYTCFYHHVFSLKECFLYFQLNELWKYISLKSYSIISRYIKLINLNFITVSQFTKDNMINNFFINNKKVIVVWNEILEKNLYIIDKLSNFSKDNDSYILIISSLIKRKNIGLIQELSKIYEKKIKFVCPYPKNNSQSKYLKNLKKNNVNILHNLTEENLRKIYLRSSCVLIPTSYEGLSLIPLESINLNKPIIMSKIKPHLYWRLPGKFYFDFNNYQDLINKLNFYLNQKNIFVDYSAFKEFRDTFRSAQKERIVGLTLIYNN